MQVWLALLAVLILTTPAQGWGAGGHHIVAQIAERLVAPATRVEVERLLEPGESLTSVSAWADEYRKRCSATGRWHYVNIPLWAERYDAARDCPETEGGCVIRAIDDARAILRDPAQTRPDRALALRLLVHFIGDLHQPLHSGDRDDRGGNDLRVRFANRSTNLHRVWDVDLIAWTRRSAERYADMLARSLQPAERRRFERGGAIQWAEESQRVARRAYGKLPERASATEPIELGDAYAEAMLSALDEQLLRAGVRLAFALDRAFGGPGRPASKATLQALKRCVPAPRR